MRIVTALGRAWLGMSWWDRVGYLVIDAAYVWLIAWGFGWRPPPTVTYAAALAALAYMSAWTVNGLLWTRRMLAESRQREAEFAERLRQLGAAPD